MFKSRYHLTLATAALTMFSVSASALETGSFLIKLNGGYTKSDSKIKSSGNPGTTNLDSEINNKNLNGYNGGVSFGYVASDNVWTDLSFSLDSLKTKDQTDNTSIHKVKSNNYSAMLNGYYGMNMSNRFSPYMMLGLGVAMAKTTLTLPSTGMVINNSPIKVTESGKAVPLTTLKSKNSSYLAYQGGFGLSFEVVPAVALDLGYRIGNLQVAKFNDISLSDGTKLNLESKNNLKHSVQLGVNILF